MDLLNKNHNTPPPFGIRATDQNRVEEGRHNDYTREYKIRIIRKIKKYRKQLDKLYPEYEYLNMSKTNNTRLEHLINIISKTEYKYIYYLKKRT